RSTIPPAGLARDEVSNGGSSSSSVRSAPRLWPPDGTGALGLLPEASHPARNAGSARQAGARPSSTNLEQRSRHPPNLRSCAFTHRVRPRVASPLMAVDPHLGRIGKIAADLDEAGAELRVENVEVVDADAPLSLGELVHNRPAL